MRAPCGLVTPALKSVRRVSEVGGFSLLIVGSTE